MSNQTPSRKLLLLIPAGVALLVLFNAMFTVNERELAVVLQFGKPVRSISEPGLYFRIPLYQQVRRLPKTMQVWHNAPEDELKDLSTGDGKKIEVSVWAIWRISDPEKFVSVLESTTNAEQQVLQRVRADVRNVLGKYDLSEAVRSTNRELTYSFGLEDLDMLEDSVGAGASGDNNEMPQVGEIKEIEVGRSKIVAEIRDLVRAQLRGEVTAEANGTESGAADASLSDRGIELIDVGITNIEFSEAVRQAAFDRLKEFMESIAAKYTNLGILKKNEILNQTDAEVQEILGEGEEQSQRLRGEVDAEIITAYADAIRTSGSFYSFLRTLQVYENSFDGDTRMILTTDSDLMNMLKTLPAPTETEEESPTSRSGFEH